MKTVDLNEQPVARLNARTPPRTSETWMHTDFPMRKSGYVLAFLLAGLAIIMRRPDCIFHAQFYAEDGAIFYAQAHNFGWLRAVFFPYEGYIHLFPRVAAGIAMLFPLALGPLVQNVLAVCVETLPVLLLISPVCEQWGTLRFRCVLALLYLTVPNCSQIIGSITESQWILALCSFLIISGKGSQSRITRFTLVALLTLSTFTGPFCIFLIPIALWVYIRERNRWRFLLMSITAGGAAIQITLLALSPRYQIASWGASVKVFLAILGSQIFTGALFGPNSLGFQFPTVAAIIAIVGLIFSMRVRRKELIYLQVFALLIFTASIWRPTIPAPQGHTLWETLVSRTAGSRYWFIPCLAVCWSVAYLALSRREWVRTLAVPLLLLMFVGVIRDFRQPARADFHFSAYAAKYAALPDHARITIPETPRRWSLTLIKR